MLCYTSGTTGNPKGVLYEHRSTVIHAMAEVAPAVFNLSTQAVVLPIVPMFHAAAWGLPFAGALAGAKFVYSAVNDAAVLCGLMNREKVTHSAGVPTVWLAMFGHIDATGEAPRHLEAGDDRRLGRAARDDRADHGHGRQGQASVGHDRDLADRHRRVAAARLGRDDARAAARPDQQAGQVAVRRRAARRR